jgi:hypothetical protein
MLKILTACATALCVALPAHADDVQEAVKLLKAGQHQQALERVNTALSAKPRYPRERDFVVVAFEQDYRPDGLSNVIKKRQYWYGRWKILYEGAA